MRVDSIMHEAHKLIDNSIRFRDCCNGEYPSFEYYYCEAELFLVRNKDSHMIMFVKARSPREAVSKVICIMKNSGMYRG